jgi:hypothetical protein
MPFEEKTFYIAGVQHHELHEVIEDLAEGDELDLICEPENKFDPNAVRIESDGTMLGYVPKKFSAEVSAALEIGHDLECCITKLTPTAKPWEQCEVSITQLDIDAEDDTDSDEPPFEDEN